MTLLLFFEKKVIKRNFNNTDYILTNIIRVFWFFDTFLQESIKV